MFLRATISMIMILLGAVSACAQEQSMVQPWLATEQAGELPDELPIRRFKRGAFQKLTFDAGTSSGGGLDVHHLGTSIGIGVPLGSFDNILVVEPSFAIDVVEAQSHMDLPSELYDIGLNLFWRKSFDDRWSAMFLSTPSLRSDLTTTEHGFRLFALGLLTYEWVPDKLAISGGAVSLGRADLPVLPAVGLKWTPSPRWRADVIFPRPRISYRLVKNGTDSETWGYLAGGIGGQTWAVTRDDGQVDEMTFGELQLTLGIEQIRDGGGGLFAELGFAFGRHLEFERQAVTIDFGNALLVNAGWKW